jgi:hypothetical protein
MTQDQVEPVAPPPSGTAAPGASVTSAAPELRGAASSPRRIGASFAAGTALAFAATCFFGPGIIGWWYEPPSKDAFSCAGSVREALAWFVKFQLISAMVGGLFMLVVVYLVRRSLAGRAANKAEPVAPA